MVWIHTTLTNQQNDCQLDSYADWLNDIKHRFHRSFMFDVFVNSLYALEQSKE